MDTFRDFSGRHIGPVARFVTPASLRELREEILRAEREDLRVHAVGSAWAFSAPAYCDGVIVDLSSVPGFPEWLQRHVTNPDRGSRVLVGAHAGMRVHDLDRALEQHPDAVARIPWLAPGRHLALPTHGGAGGQRVAGAFNTGTHGGDVARPPMGDFVRALVLVGSGGVVSVVQSDTDPVLDFHGLRPELQRLVGPGAAIRELRSDEVLAATVVAVGRMGVVFAYVVETADETGFFLYERRQKRNWSEVRADLQSGAPIAAMATADGFYQVVIDPLRRNDGERHCFETKHLRMPEAEVSTAGSAFGLGPVASVDVVAERARGAIPPLIGQAFCVDHLTFELEALRVGLVAAAAWTTLAFFPFGAIVAAPLFEAAASIARIGPEHRIGDVIADVINLVSRSGHPELLEQINHAILDKEQSDTRPDPLGGPPLPWLVHGRRAEICDFFDYDNDCYRGDSIEVFFDAAPGLGLADKLESIFTAFDEMRAAGKPLAAYISLRFMAPSRSLLGMAAHPVSCAVEVAMLRGIEGNDEALKRIKDIAVGAEGRVHWGQENDLTPQQVAQAYGGALPRWKQVLTDLELDSDTFSTPFSRQRGLEPSQPGMWHDWEDAGIVAGRQPGVVSARGARPLQAFVIAADGRVQTSARPATASASSWSTVREEPVDPLATPVPILSPDGRIELFVRGDDRLKHTWEEHPRGPFVAWDEKGSFLGHPGPRVSFDPSVAAHRDGRLEVVACGFDPPIRMLHSWAAWANGPWSGLVQRGSQEIAGQPSLCLRLHPAGATATDQLVAAACREDGTVLWVGQLGPGGNTPWTDWQELRGGGGPALAAASHPLAVGTGGAGLPARILVIDAAGQVQEAVDDDVAVGIGWGAWQPLPPLPGSLKLESAAGLVAVQSTRLSIFGVSLRRRVVGNRFLPATGWGAWSDLGGEVFGGIAAGVLDDGQVEILAANAANGRLMARKVP